MSREDAESLNGTASSNSLRYMPAPVSTRNRTDQPFTEHAYNGTGYYVDNDDVDNSEYSGRPCLFRTQSVKRFLCYNNVYCFII